MITKQDEKKVDQIIGFLKKHETTNETRVDWEKLEWMDTLNKLVNNLKIAPVSYKFSPTDKNYYYAKCACGWHGSSELLNGGGQIADTGDYSDCTCPVCDSIEIDEKIEVSNEK